MLGRKTLKIVDDGDGLDNDYDDDCDDDGILGQVAQWGAGQSDSCL